MPAIDGKDTREREKIVKEIVKTSEAIRKKHRALKTGKIEEDIALKRHFSPIIKPLQKIVDSSGMITLKTEPENSASDVAIKSLPIQKHDDEKDEEEEEEEYVTPYKKRSLSNLSTLDRSKLTPRRSNKSQQGLFTSPNLTMVASTPTATKETFTPVAAMETVQPTLPELLTNENVFETTDDSFMTTLRDQLETFEGQKTLQNQLGSLSHKYINAVLHNESGIDKTYGVRLTKDGMMFGNKRFDVDKADNMLVDSIRYVGTPGLYELIFKKIPDDDLYTETDMQTYKSMLLTTNAHKINYDAYDRVKSNRGYKYKHVIAPLLPIESKKKSGKGLFMPYTMTLHEDNKIDYVHWNDPNELVDRARLLNASRQAGNNAHDNEIVSIIEELREAGIIIN